MMKSYPFPLADAVYTGMTSPIDWRRDAAQKAAHRENLLRGDTYLARGIPSIYD
jgi:hypothetical protein